MKKVNKLLLSVAVMVAFAITQLTHINVGTVDSDSATVSVEIGISEAHAQFDGAGCGQCPQLATPAMRRLCSSQNNCNVAKPADPKPAEPVVDKPVDKPDKPKGKKGKKNKRPRRIVDPVDPCGDGTCDEDGGESFETCPADCLCGNSICDEGEGTCLEDCCPACDGDCTPTTCDDNVDGIKNLTILTESLLAKIDASETKIEALDAKIEALKASQVKNTWISGIGNDMLIVIILLGLILLLIVIPLFRKEEKDDDTKGDPNASERGAPGAD